MIAFLAISERRVFPVRLVLEELHCRHFLRIFMMSNWGTTTTTRKNTQKINNSERFIWPTERSRRGS